MTIEVKRNCSSSVRTTLDKVSFGDFTITIDGDDFERWKKLKHDSGGLSDVTLLRDLILVGLYQMTEPEEEE